MPRALTSLGRLSCWVHSVLCVSFLLQPNCFRHTAPESRICLNSVPFCLVQPGRGSGLGQGLCSEATHKLKELVCLLYMDGYFKWIRAW